MDNEHPNNIHVDYVESSVDMDPSSNQETTDLDFDLDDCKSLIVRKCSTGLDLPPKVNLYSENVVKEEETTEHVDRGSIADLAAIKKHWEQRFESEEAEKAPVKKAQRVVRHWSVKLANIPGRPNNRKDEPIPEVVNRNQEMTTAVNDDYNENESAIEREIRWAMEREEMLRQEQEQRQYRRELMLEKEEEEKQLNGVQTQQIIEHYENTDKEKFKPTYHEMTEADLGHEISKKEAIKELEMRQQKELALQNGESVTSEDSTDKLNPTPIHYRETVVQMEIRLQRERDAQFKEQQKLLNSSNKVKSEPVTEITNDNDVIVNNNNNDSPAPPPPVSEPEPEPVPEPTPAPVQETKPVLYKHEVENKIAQELEEAKAREEEFRQRIKSIESAEDLENSVKSLELNESTMSASSESDSAGPTANKTSPFLNETPIEREIRLAREREEEYRRQKGYPTSEKVSTQRSVELKTDTARLPKYNLKNKPVKGDTMKKIAASRLQHEIKQERSREVTLRESGRINTTSDERVGEQKKYKEVAEGPVKRNFVTAKKPVVKVESAVAAATESQASDADSNLSSSQKKNGPNYVIKTPKISTTFSFREAKSNAGSMIEQELKEMREREEELKKQREYMQNKANNNETNE